jgi:hypothetical protein
MAQSAGVAAAQPAEEARVLFEQANGALESGRFAEARDLLRRSLALSDNAASAFNLGVALRGTGETLAAASVFEALLEGGHGAISDAQKREVQRLLRETRAEIAVLHIHVEGADVIDVRVDGARIARAGDGETVSHDVDPGEHVVTVSASRRQTEERRVTLDRGGSRELGLTLEMSEDARLGRLVVEAVDPDDVLEIIGVARGNGTLTRDLEPGAYDIVVAGPAGRRESTVDLEAGTTLRVRLDGESGGVLSSPWFWTGVGLVLVGLAIGGIFLFADFEDPPVSDPVYGVVTTLTLP